MKTVGIDIGSYSIKIAELEGSGSNIRVLKLIEHSLSQRPGVDKDLELITTLKDAVNHYDKENTQFVLGLPQDKISSRNLFFPFKEKYKILKSLPFELEDLIPFSAFDAIFEGKIIKTLPHGSEVLSVAAPKELIKKYLSLSADVQIDPKIISLEGFALNNLFEDIFEAPPERENGDGFEDIADEEHASSDQIGEAPDLEDGEAILDIGHSSSILVVRSQGSLRNIRRINWGALNLIRAIAKQEGLQEHEAMQRIKASKGILPNSSSASEEDLKFSQALSHEVLKLGKVLSLTLLEVKGVNHVNIKGIGLLGGLSSLPNIGAKLTEATLIACNKISKLKNYPEIDLALNYNNEMSMGVAIGLALEAFRRAKNPALNFRREEFSKENSSFKKMWNQWGFYVNLAAASIAVFFVYAFLRNSLSEDIALSARRSMKSAASDVFQIPKQMATEQKLKKLFSNLEKRNEMKSKIISKTKASANAPLKLLKQISDKAGSRSRMPIDISSLKIEGDQIEIKGNTKARRELPSFTKKLKALATGKVSKNERTNPNGSVDFTITFKPKKGL